MSINFRKPNGYYITRFKYDLNDVIKSELLLDESKNPDQEKDSSHESDDNVQLMYNGEKAVSVDRKKISQSCHFLSCLVGGSFKEANQNSIDIFLEDYTFESFEAVLAYATTGKLYKGKGVSHYINMIQLARVWMYDELVDEIEAHLTTCISIETITNLHTLANMLELDILREDCIKVEQLMDTGVGSLNVGWGRCPHANHQFHHYSNCTAKNPPTKPEEENWDNEDF